ncbi:MAG: exodeoxyribonuclease III [Clostridiales bacterium]|nr:exodeoxyribonuclease III [Clostridiales bacterium]
MKLVSWNVNGVRAVYQKGFKEIFNNFNADIFCIQETKMQEGQLDLTMEGYNVYLNSAERKGYSGTAVWTKIKPISVSKGIGIEEHDKEGRVLTLEYNEFYLVNVYTPNSKRELERLEYRVVWENEFRKYLKKLEKNKPVILCGDLNVAHKELDVKNDKTNRNSAGFTDEERREFQNLLNENFVDTFRVFYPDKEKFSWWSYFGKAREKNVGWRIDYFVVSEVLKNKLKDAEIHDQVFGSDHCPVSIDIEF